MTTLKNPTIEKIHSRGYWRVNIHPTMFKKDRFTLSQCTEIMESSVVRLRVSPYPYLREGEIIVGGKDWIEWSGEYDCYIEYWRYYRSGQFIHHFACYEDWMPSDNITTSAIRKLRKAGESYLSLTPTIFSITEIFEFAARLAAKNAFTPGAVLSIKLENIKDRTLIWDSFLGHTLSIPTKVHMGLRKSHIPEIEFEGTFSDTDLLSRSSELALDAVESIFGQFNVDTSARDIWAQEQARLFERRW